MTFQTLCIRDNLRQREVVTNRTSNIFQHVGTSMTSSFTLKGGLSSSHPFTFIDYFSATSNRLIIKTNPEKKSMMLILDYYS